MNKALTLSTVFFLLAFFGCQPISDETLEISNLDAVLKNISDPPVDYRTAPLWDWNDKITKEEIEYQLIKFKEGGLGGVFIHPRPGLVTEYLSDEWNGLFKYTVQKGKELGMKVWIYDENSYPSGFAGGHVQSNFPDSYKNGTGLGFKKTNNLADTIGLDIEAILKKESDSDYYIFHRTYPDESWWYGGYPYVDLLYPGVTDTFIKVTMEGYEKYFGDEFGKTVPGIFTDEPNLPAAKGKGTAIRWTPDLFDRFKERWGYSLEENLISLVEEYGEWKKVRHNYHELMLELFLDRWAVPWNQYCESKNLIWTGHYWEHGWPVPGEGYDESAFYMYHQMPGIDMLGRSLCEDGMCQQFGNIRAVRELASAANQSGANRRFSETYGGSGWQVTFRDLKRLLDWECVLGVNFVNQHLSYFSMEGVRKFDYPPSFSYQEPWWSDHKLLGDYTARISLALSAGQQINKVLIIQPNTTAWMYHADSDPHNELFDLSVKFKSFLIELESKQLEYDLGSEQVIKRFGRTVPEGLEIKERTYKKIVLAPGMRNLDSSTFDFLKEHLESGHKLLILSDSVDYIDGSESDILKHLIAKNNEGVTVLKEEQSGEIIKWIDQEEISLKTVKGDPELVFHQRRILEDGEMLFLVNSDLTSEAEVLLSWKGKYLSEVDLVTGNLLPLNYQINDKRIESTISLPPVGSRLLIASDKKLINKPTDTKKTTKEILAEDAISVNRDFDNILTLDFLDLETKDFKLKDVYFMEAMYKLFEWSELPTGNPWQHKIQFKKTYLEMDEFDETTWHEISYQFVVAEDMTKEQFKTLKLVAERPDIWTVAVNGKNLKPENGKWWIDRHFPVYHIGELVNHGINNITLKANRMSVFAEVMPVYILGNFRLEKADKGFIIKPETEANLGHWDALGWPFYGNKVSYQQNFILDSSPKENERYSIQVEDWKGVVSQILVNNELAGTLGWQSEIDVTDFITKGSNNIKVVISGSLKNTLGFHHKDLQGWIDGPFSWNQAPDHQPPGKDYRFMNYGLKGKIKLIKQSTN